MKITTRIKNAFLFSLLAFILISSSLFISPMNVAFSAAGDPPAITISSPAADAMINTGKVVISGTYTDDNVQQMSELLFTAYDQGVEISNSDNTPAEWIFGNNETSKTWTFTKSLKEGSHNFSVEIKEKSDLPEPITATASISFTVSNRPFISSAGIIQDGKERIGEDLTRVPQDAKIKITIIDDNPMNQFVSKIESTGVPYNPIKVTAGTTSIIGSSSITKNSNQSEKYTYEITFTPTSPLALNTTYLVYVDSAIMDDLDNPINTKFFKFTTKSDLDETENPHGHYALNTNMCAACHSTHLGMNNSLEGGSYQVTFNDKLKADPSQNYCMACHDGTLNAPIINQMEKAYHHNNPAEYSQTGTNNLKQAESCTSCHNPHLEWSEQNQNILKDHYVYTHKDEDRNSNGLTSLVVDSAETSCDTCHGDTSIYDQNKYPGIYEVLKYNKSFTAEGTITAKVLDKNPDRTVQTVSDYSLCLRCHNAAKKTIDPTMADIETYYADSSSGHNFTLPEGKQTQDDGSPLNGPIPCAECHDTHGSDNIKLLRNQLGNAETSNKFTMSGKDWTASSERQFCTKCHNGSTTIYGRIGKLDQTVSEGHDPAKPKGQQACSTCHSASFDPAKPESIDKAFLEAAHAPKTGVDRSAP
ncbi:cytochrome c3 family protein [Neobacillus sp. PS3-34]|uniref:multiheme c-type cytochrome n=1 Tax=Neobacillus sp. PS3-34 TaxID=3070678 RepID=UPI0027DF9E7C|nr:cytochrome c3 family protein [Neobacillus sp. PS3-34]WML46915.1 cytochrome c3 family protein [Neobacillus sp. PS3-34]